MRYSLLTKPDEVLTLIQTWSDMGVNSVAMDFEEESNLHCYGEYICIVQLYDQKHYYILDALQLAKTQAGIDALRTFLEGPIEKIMFACQSDAALARKTLNIQIQNVFDIRIIAIALGFTGNLTALIQRSLGIEDENPSQKKKYQTANWMIRPLSAQQIQYALSDVKHLFALKASLTAEMSRTLPRGRQNQIRHQMLTCALPKHPDRPGWEKICNFRMLTPAQRIYLKHFFLARDSLARAANLPANRILEKQLLVDMAKRSTWVGVLPPDKNDLSPIFEQARLSAMAELLAP